CSAFRRLTLSRSPAQILFRRWAYHSCSSVFSFNTILFHISTFYSAFARFLVSQFSRKICCSFRCKPKSEVNSGGSGVDRRLKGWITKLHSRKGFTRCSPRNALKTASSTQHGGSLLLGLPLFYYTPQRSATQVPEVARAGGSVSYHRALDINYFI
ncbi:hypothetical protein Ocin01_09465, partial [Orchesella cincta]